MAQSDLTKFYKYFLKNETIFIRRLVVLFCILTILSIVQTFFEYTTNIKFFSITRFITFIIGAIITFIIIRKFYKFIECRIKDYIDLCFVHIDKVEEIPEKVKLVIDVFENELGMKSSLNYEEISKSSKNFIDNLNNITKTQNNIPRLTNKIIEYTNEYYTNINKIIIQEIKEHIKSKENFFIDIIRSSLCLNCTYINIYSEFTLILQDKLKSDLNRNLENVNNIKQNYEKIYDEINNISKSFLQDIKDTVESHELSNEKIKFFYENYSAMSDHLERTINYFYEEYKKLEDILTNVEDISEQTRIIALNLSIEASKSNIISFNVISKELQNLSLKTQEFIRNISGDIKKSIKKIEEDKEENIKIIKLMNENIINNKKINEIFSSNINNLIKISYEVEKDIDFILKDKEKLFSLFDLIQNFYYELEILGTVLNFFLEFQKENSEKVHQKLGGKKGICADEEMKKNLINEILNMVKSKIRTKIEKEALNQLYLKYLNRSIDENYLEDDKDVIIF